MNQSQWEALLEHQRELEDNSLALGGQRFRKRIAAAQAAGKSSTVGAAKKLLQCAIEPLELGLIAMIQEIKGKRGPKHYAFKWVEAVGVDAAAYMTVKTVLDGIARRTVLRQAALDISQLILDELRYRRFLEKAPGLFNYRMSKFTTSSYAHMARSLNAAIKYADIDISDLEMTPRERVLVGAKLIDALVQTTSIVEVVSQKKPGRSKRDKVKGELYLVATGDTLEWMKARNDALEFLQPVSMPMVVPPLPWASKIRGGYRFALRNKFSLVRGVSNEHQHTIADTEMPIVYSAVNMIQNTAWKINADVIEIVEAILRKGGSMAGVPSFEDEPLPPRPADIDTNEEARRTWRRAAHGVKERNHLRGVRAVEYTKVLTSARSVAQELAIYFPYNLDFRGRIYPISNYLSPQGGDLSRALLTFADAKPVGSEGGTWLAIHGANCLGESPEGTKMSKLSLVEREQWVIDHTEQIKAVASDPFTATWWTVADKPLQFYAFCMEWARYIAALAEGQGQEFISGLPIAQDGSCNGLQHFAALLRDERGGRAVNLIPAERPEDIYQRIADKVLDKLEERAASTEYAKDWLTSNLVTRKLCKRPTMTFGYGSKKFGFRSQLIEYLMGLENWQQIRMMFTDENGRTDVGDACSLLSELIWESLREMVVSAFDGMAWMQKAVRKVVVNNKPVSWCVPATAFPVRQEYFVNNKKQVKTILAGKVIQPSLYEKTDQIEQHKQCNAVAPNFIHSLDAAALMLTVGEATAEGVEAFGMIHDSYATVAGDCSVLSQATRQSFVRLYQHNDVIGDFYRQLSSQMEKPEDCPVPPMMGELDIGVVLASKYFFA